MFPIFSFQRGKIEIKLSKFNFAAGETINGVVELRLKKPILAKTLSIQLIGTQNSSSMSGGRRINSTRTIFDVTQPLDGEKEYGTELLSYPFQITIPSSVVPVLNGPLGTVLKTIQMFGGQSNQVRWYLIGRLPVAGFDITKKVAINVV